MRHGFLLINKPVGPTSHDIVDIVRERLHERDVGHLGTLDPAAEGLLILAVGSKALKVIELFQNLSKEDEAWVQFGSTSTTYDREGVIEEKEPPKGWTQPDSLKIRRLIEDRFVGKIAQIPPAASAVSIGGERAYRKFRQGKGVNIPSRTVEIEECSITSYTYPELHLHVRCGSGTYIRSLAHDLGEALRCGGYLTSLKRTVVGPWTVVDAVDPGEVQWAHVSPLKEILKPFSRIDITSEQGEDLRHGRDISIEIKPNTIAWLDDLPVGILIPSKDGSQGAHARKIF
ncbi:tRNA pseudouridine(55) synthase TruB [Candidatus Peribacteria bacterium RIFCSPHIGHO2_01_FULL_51_9]|nr:MAG: tRNA pseudouridine(55) synthase TruB [Candidatus Peribacteria bacterium RIFCSPHIGHO2_01_FULL_51_9]